MDDHQLCNRTSHFIVLLCCRAKKQPTKTKINLQFALTNNQLQMFKYTNKKLGNVNKVNFVYMNINENYRIVSIPSTVYQKFCV